MATGRANRDGRALSASRWALFALVDCLHYSTVLVKGESGEQALWRYLDLSFCLRLLLKLRLQRLQMLLIWDPMAYGNCGTQWHS